MSKRFVNPAFSGPWCLVFLISLIWQLSGPVHAQSQPQVDLTGKNTLIQRPGVSGASAQSDLASKKVLFLHSFAYAQPVYKIIDAALIESFVSNGLNFNNLYFEFLDLARNPGQKYRNELVNIFRQKYQGRKFDLVVAAHQQSLEFLMKEGQSFYPEGPIICILGDPVSDIEHSDSKRPLIYLPFSIDVTSTIKAIFTLQPDTQKIVIIAGSAPMDRRFLDLVQAALKAWKGKLDVEVIPPLPLDEILKKVAYLPTKTAILYTNVAADSTGKTYMPRDVARMISRSANVPVFGLYETLLGDNGIVGGTILNHQLEGERAARLAMEILRGQLPSKPLTIFPAPLVPMFDWLQLKRWGMNEAALSANTIILNKPASPWDRYKFYIIGGLAFVLLETALIIFLIVQRRRKKVAEGELNQFFNISLDLKCIANTDGYFVRLNPAWERTFGYTLEELMAKRFLEFVHPDDLDKTREAISNLASQQKILLFENRYRCKDGTYRWLEWSSAPAGKLIHAAARDVTERKLAERALEERLRFERLLSGLSARFVIIPPDRVDSEIEDGLRKILEFFQVDHCALIRTSPGKTSYQITHVASSDNVPPVPVGAELPRSINPWAYEKLVEKNEVVSISRLDDLPAEANADRQTCIEWGIRSFVNIPILSGESVGHIINVSSVKNERVWPEEFIPRLQLLGEIFVNALKRKQAEAEAARARTELGQVERSSRMGELTASLAHEINQPLGAILSSAQAALRFLESATPDLNLFRTILQNIVQDDKRAAGVITSLRSMLKREESRRELLNMNTVLDEVLNLFHSEAIIRNVTIERDIDGSLPPVLGDKIQLQQVLLNLVMNAAEAMSESPHEHEKRRIILRTQATDHGIQVAVRDFGPGIDPEKLGDIWRPLFTTKSTGLGLGLSVSRSIIQAHGGRISAENHPDGGAMFAFEIPVIRNQ